MLTIPAFSQIVFKLDRPMLKIDWIKASDYLRDKSITNFDAYLKVKDENGKVWTVTGEKPVDPLGPYSWRPPIIPPLKKDLFIKSILKTTSASINPAKTLAVAGNCNTCSALTFNGQLSEENKGFLNKLFAPYQK